MAFKNIEVALKLQMAGFTSGLAAASAQTRAFGQQLSNDLGQAKSRDIERIGTAGLVAGGALLAGFGLAARATLDFDKTLSDLEAVSGATGDEMGKLRQQALDAGAATAFSATEAAQAQAELAKAGISTADILSGGLEGALALAAAGNLDLATAATYAANAMTTFGLAGEDVGHIADVLAAGANKSAADVDEIGQALQQTGLVADQFGLTLDDTVGVLSAFAQAGLKGSDAGTSLKTMLQRLGGPSVEAANEMERLGINVFDAQGNFVGAERAAQVLQDGLSGLTQEQRAAAMQTIFGADAVRAATIFYELGAEGVDKWVTAVDDSGFAGDVAATKMDNLAGDIEELGGSIETALIQGGSGATSVLRTLTQGATEAVNAFGNLPAGVQGAVVSIAGVAGAVLTVVGGLGVMIPKVQAGRAALESLGRAGVIANRGIGLLGAGLGRLSVAGAVVGGLLLLRETLGTVADEVNKLDVSDAENELLDLAETGKFTGDELERFFANLEAAGDMDPGEWASQLESDLKRIDEALASLQARDPEAAAAAYDLIIDKLEQAGVSSSQAKDQFEQYRSAVTETDTANRTAADGAGAAGAAMEDTGAAAEEAAEGTDTLGDAMETLADDAATAEDKLSAYKDAADAVIGVHLSSFEAATAFGGAITSLTDELTDGKLTFDEFTEAGQENRDALSGAAQSAIDHAVAVGQEQGSVGAANMVLAGHVGQLRDVMEQSGLTDEQIDTMITTMGLTPENIETLIELGNYTGATQALDSHQQNIDDTKPEVNTRVGVPGAETARVRLREVKEEVLSIRPSRNVHISTSGAQGAMNDLDNIARRINALGNTNVRISVGGGGGAPLRWGGAWTDAAGSPMWAAQSGLAWQAGMAQSPTILFGERATGGEAFIPRRGNRGRSLSILDMAAGWYGQQVIPEGVLDASRWPTQPFGGAGGGGVTHVTKVQVDQVVADDLSPMGRVRMELAVEAAVQRAVRGLTAPGL